ncbi:MAG: 30S ribosomal protein S16, partial [Anaerolineales bacterium]|nr:30S ribosomal protein S16 [Anaerolineales bacterium]
MVRIRLRRVGARHQPSYRIVAADKESPRDGRFLENLGFYNPRTEPSTVEIKEDRLFHWLKNGAQPSDAVVKVLKPLGTWDRWERFKGGEDIEGLLEEAEASKVSVDPRTRRDDLAESRKSKKKAKAEAQEKAAPEAAVADAPAIEVEEPETEAEQEAEPEAEKEAEEEAPEVASIAEEPAIEVEEPAIEVEEAGESEADEEPADEAPESEG